MLSPTMTAKVVDSGSEGEATASTTQTIRTPQKSRLPGKARSLSDSTPHLEPSPKFHESLRTSKDDHTILESPRTPRRPELLSRGLSLQMPSREMPMPSPAHFAARVPLSPQLDARNTYASPASLLPRRSRGAEFSRACTNLHHSTLADQSSPDSSPTITQKGMTIPSGRNRENSMVMDSPNVLHSAWGHGDRTTASSSVGSISMLDPDDSSSNSDEGESMYPDDNDDPMLMTPQALKHSTPFGGPIGNNTGTWSNMFSPGGVPTFMSIQRARLRKGRSRKSSSSASGHSGMASPGPASPPTGKGEGHFARDAGVRKAGSRRESLSLFTNDLQISSGNDSGDESLNMPQTPGVVRRHVTRRGNLLVSHQATFTYGIVLICSSPSQDNSAASRQNCWRNQHPSTTNSVAKLKSSVKFAKAMENSSFLLPPPHNHHPFSHLHSMVSMAHSKTFRRRKVRAI
jgi:hypothetical protein